MSGLAQYQALYPNISAAYENELAAEGISVNTNCRGALGGIYFWLGQGKSSNTTNSTTWEDPYTADVQDLASYGMSYRDVTADAMIGNGPKSMEVAWVASDTACGICPMLGKPKSGTGLELSERKKASLRSPGGTTFLGN